MRSSMWGQRADLVDLGPCLEVVALVMAAQQLESLVHMVPGILDLMEEQTQDRVGTVRGMTEAVSDH